MYGRTEMDIKLFDSELKVMEVLWQYGDTPAKRIAEIINKQVRWKKSAIDTCNPINSWNIIICVHPWRTPFKLSNNSKIIRDVLDFSTLFPINIHLFLFFAMMIRFVLRVVLTFRLYGLDYLFFHHSPNNVKANCYWEGK